MQLTDKQTRQLLHTHGVYVNEVCDGCGAILDQFASPAKAMPAHGARAHVVMV